jgi:pantoate--beta-alanine ligase
MGALHAGHRALIERSAAENPLTVVSVFVNPTQFSDATDLAHYPRNLASDAASAQDWGADMVFAPGAEDVYPPDFDTWVEVGQLGQLWEGASRPGHFRGVATVVAILLNCVRPARSYFGEKDYQQLQVIRRMHRDLALPGAVVGCPTVRDADRLALSSRNARLSAPDRLRAAAIPRALAAMIDATVKGEFRSTRLEDVGRIILEQSEIDVDYLAVVAGESLHPVERMQPGARALVAANVGGVRLIDNAELNASQLAAVG